MPYFSDLINARPELLQFNICDTKNREYDCKTPIQQNDATWPVKNTPAMFDTDILCKEEKCGLNTALVADMFIGLELFSAGIISGMQHHIKATCPGLVFDIELISQAALGTNPNATGFIIAAGVGGVVDHGYTTIAPADGFIDMYGQTVGTGATAYKCVDRKVLGIRIKQFTPPVAGGACTVGMTLDCLKLALQVEYTPFHHGGITFNGQQTDYNSP